MGGRKVEQADLSKSLEENKACVYTNNGRMKMDQRSEPARVVDL